MLWVRDRLRPIAVIRFSLSWMTNGPASRLLNSATPESPATITTPAKTASAQIIVNPLDLRLRHWVLSRRSVAKRLSEVKECLAGYCAELFVRGDDRSPAVRHEPWDDFVDRANCPPRREGGRVRRFRQYLLRRSSDLFRA